LLSSSEHSGVPKDSKSPLFQVLGFTPTLDQVRVVTSDAKDNPYEAPTLAYNKEMGQLTRRKNYQRGGGGLCNMCKC
jgi:hypothetical protein